MIDRTELIVVLDRSGSMEQGQSDHEGGLRSFVRDQQTLAGDVRLTFVRFDSHEPFELVLDGVPLSQVSPNDLTLVPRGGTPLLDAVGRTITHVAGRLKEVDPPPHQIILMVITDGHENSSHEYSAAQIKALIAEKEAAGWKALYLGANVDEFAEAGSIGIAAGASLGYAASATGIGAMYESLCNNVNMARSAVQHGKSQAVAYAALNFVDEQRVTAKSGYAEWEKRMTTSKSESTSDLNTPQQ